MTIGIWSINTAERIKTLTSHFGKISSVVFSREGKYLVSGSTDKTVRV